MTDRVNARRQLADARERIVAQLDKAWQRTANLEEQVRKLTAQANEARAEHSALRDALDALGPAPARRNRKAATTPAPTARLKRAVPAPEGVAAMGNGAAERTLAAAAEAGLLPGRAS